MGSSPPVDVVRVSLSKKINIVNTHEKFKDHEYIMKNHVNNTYYLLVIKLYCCIFGADHVNELSLILFMPSELQDPLKYIKQFLYCRLKVTIKEVRSNHGLIIIFF